MLKHWYNFPLLFPVAHTHQTSHYQQCFWQTVVLMQIKLGCMTLSHLGFFQGINLATCAFNHYMFCSLGNWKKIYNQLNISCSFFFVCAKVRVHFLFDNWGLACNFKHYPCIFLNDNEQHQESADNSLSAIVAFLHRLSLFTCLSFIPAVLYGLPLPLQAENSLVHLPFPQHLMGISAQKTMCLELNLKGNQVLSSRDFEVCGHTAGAILDFCENRLLDPDGVQLC